MKKLAYWVCVAVAIPWLVIAAYLPLSGLWHGFGSFFNSQEITGTSIGVSATCRNNIVDPCEEINPISTIAYTLPRGPRKYLPIHVRIAQDTEVTLMYNEKHPTWIRYSTGETQEDINMIFSQNSQDLIILILMMGGIVIILRRIKTGLFEEN